MVATKPANQIVPISRRHGFPPGWKFRGGGLKPIANAWTTGQQWSLHL